MLIHPYGEKLVDLLAAGQERAALAVRAAGLKSIQLSARALCDLELLAVGAFSPLDRFMGEADYGRVLREMRLADGTLFPIPFTLPVPPAAGIRTGTEIALRDSRYEVVAVMRVDELFSWDPAREARQVYGTEHVRHPLVAEMNSWDKLYAGGPLTVFQVPRHRDFPQLRRSPLQVRALLEDLGSSEVVAFHTRNPIGRVHEELAKRAAAQVRGVLLVHPVVESARPGDIGHYTRVRASQFLVDRYCDPQSTVLSLLPLATRLAGPREVLLHAIIRRNYGANHLIVGPDHASPEPDSSGKPFYGPYDAQQALRRHGPELGVHMVPFQELVYLPQEDRYEEAGRVPPGARSLSISPTEVRDGYLAKGRPLPPWVARPEVAAILAGAFPPADQRGFCVWFTGLPSSGKSTIADILAVMLMERGRQATLLDGDVVRTHLSKGLGFSREDRDTNILRIGFVAAEIVRHGGAVICAAVSPYSATRNQVRTMVASDGFIVVYVDTPAEECARRDVKGLYAQARAGRLQGFTGVDDPYEPPADPELTLTTTGCAPEANAARVIAYLEQRGFILPAR